MPEMIFESATATTASRHERRPRPSWLRASPRSRRPRVRRRRVDRDAQLRTLATRRRLLGSASSSSVFASASSVASAIRARYAAFARMRVPRKPCPIHARNARVPANGVPLRRLALRKRFTCRSSEFNRGPTGSDRFESDLRDSSILFKALPL